MTKQTGTRYVKGKLARTIDNFCNSITPASLWRFDIPYRDDLVKSISSLHHKYVDSQTAESILIDCTLSAIGTKIQSFNENDALPPEIKDQVRSNIVDIIESIPIKYTYIIELPHIPAFSGRQFDIAQGIRIERSATGLNKPPSSPREGIGSITTSDLSTQLRIDVEGYADGRPESPAFASAISIAKQCFFLLSDSNAMGLGSMSARARTSFLDHKSGVHRVHDGPSAIATSYGALQLKNLSVVDDSQGMGLLRLNWRNATTPDEKDEAIDNGLNNLRRYFSVSNHLDFESISAAIEWLHDSQFADNQTIAFIAACIGLEALVGSSKQLEGMSLRLADRYGFLMGTNRQERENLSEEYHAILRARGKLVHARTARLTGEYVKLLYRAQSFLFRAIEKELERTYKAT